STALASGQALNLVFASTSVTAMRALARRSERAQSAPPKPPPITMTRGPEFCEIAGAAIRAAADAATPVNTPRRLVCVWFSPLPAAALVRGTALCLRKKLGWQQRRHPFVAATSRLGQVLILDRQVADPFAGCRSDPIEHRGCCHEDRRLAVAAPE